MTRATRGRKVVQLVGEPFGSVVSLLLERFSHPLRLAPTGLDRVNQPPIGGLQLVGGLLAPQASRLHDAFDLAAGTAGAIPEAVPAQRRLIVAAPCGLS